MAIKTINLLFLLLVLTAVCRAQSNTFPNSGEAGIGTTNPRAPLHIYVDGTNTTTTTYPSITNRGDVLQFFQANNNALEFGLAKGFNDRKAWILTRHDDIDRYGDYYATLHFQPQLDDVSKYRGVAIGYPVSYSVPLQVGLAVKGNVGIGTIDPQAKLAVNGNILAKEIKIKTDISVPDYVFEPDYDLPTLEEIEAHVQQHKHLPEIPSAADIKRDGLDVAEMNLLLLKKVEELTLHLIEKDKQVKQMVTVIEQLQMDVAALKANK